MLIWNAMTIATETYFVISSQSVGTHQQSFLWVHIDALR